MESDEKQRRPRGGQLKDPAERKRNNLTFRARDRLKASLEAEAGNNGRSVSEEIEHRLERSFNRDEMMQYFDGLLSDSLIKGRDVEKANARIAELEALLRAAL